MVMDMRGDTRVYEPQIRARLGDTRVYEPQIRARLQAAMVMDMMRRIDNGEDLGPQDLPGAHNSRRLTSHNSTIYKF